MPSRAGLNSFQQASRKVISHIDNHHPQTDGAAHAAQKAFTSALDTHLVRPTTALRRRGSDGGSPSSRQKSSRHHRPKSPSMDSPNEPHPLRRSNTNPKTTRYDDDRGSTRPHLSRVLAPSSPVLARPPDGLPQFDRAEPHRTVLAHEVLPNDTLAGVALRYGISVTELRRANQLWASDSIHLRQVLYVPLDKAHHADLETVASLLAQRTDSEEDAVDAPAPCLDPPSSGSDSSAFVRRIPSANLSFFPPPSTRPSTPPPPGGGGSPFASTSPSYSRSNSPATVSTHSRGPNLGSSLRANAISSLFSILPINASTRDEIMSRLSIDSVSNSTTASDEAEHELTTVPTTPKARIDAPATTTISAPLAVNSRRKNHAHAWFSESNEPYGYGEPYPRDAEQIALASSPIHTTQMQPAPAMQLPESMTRSPPSGHPPNDPHSDAWRVSGGDHRRMR